MTGHGTIPPGHADGGEIQQAMQALQRGQPAHARKVLARALAKDAESAQANYLSGIACHMQGEAALAVGFFQEAVRLAPDDPAVRTGLGISLHDSGDRQQAISQLRHACALAPDVPAYWFNLGKALLDSGAHPGQAQEAFQRVLELDPDHVLAHIGMSDTHVLIGTLDKAVAHYRKVLRRNPEHAKAWLGLVDISTEPLTSKDVADLERAWHKAGNGSPDAIALGFALARAKEGQGDHASAFETLLKANAAKRASIVWDARSEREYLLGIERAFPVPQRTTSNDQLGHQVIFVLSLPRSGSTLVEQILSAHPDVEAAGEVTTLQDLIEEESTRRGVSFPGWVDDAGDEDWNRLGREYLERSRPYLEDAGYVTDKNLLNWKLAGAAQAMLPGARFIFVHRDAVETCLACFRQLFRTGNPFSYDLEEMADYFLSCRRLCGHWSRLFPEAWYNLSYEELIDTPDKKIHDILEFCGLSDDPACLNFRGSTRVVRTASAAQVRRPIGKDTARATRYGTALEPLRRALEKGAE